MKTLRTASGKLYEVIEDDGMRMALKRIPAPDEVLQGVGDMYIISKPRDGVRTIGWKTEVNGKTYGEVTAFKDDPDIVLEGMLLAVRIMHERVKSLLKEKGEE